MKISPRVVVAVATIVAVTVIGALFLTGKKGTGQAGAASTTSTHVSPAVGTEQLPGTENGKVLVDLSLCKLQQEKVYLCPAEALANFGPVTVKNTSQDNTCSISYDRTRGYTFKGAVKAAELPAGDFLASVTESGGIANIVRSSNSLALTFFVGGSERVVHVMVVDGKDYSRDQCLEI